MALLTQPTTAAAGFALLRPLRHWLNQVTVTNRRLAHLICRVIPRCCPFERDLMFLGYTVHVPPLCTLNPLYNELVALRVRSLTYLADVCGEDIARYLC